MSCGPLTSIECVKSAVPIWRIAWSSWRIGRAIRTANRIASASAMPAVELANRSRDQNGEQKRERQRNAGGGEREIEPFLPPLRCDLLQPLDRALGEIVGRAEERLRTVRELRVAVGKLCLRLGGMLWRHEQLVQAAFAVGETVEGRQLIGGQRQKCELARGAPELLAQAHVIVDERAVLENQELSHYALQRDGLLEQLAARASGLRRLLHGLLSLQLQPIERKDQLRKRVDQRQADQQETQQNEFEKRARVIHGTGRYNLRQL